MFEFHVSRIARDKFAFDKDLFGFDGNVIFANFLSARLFAQKINQKRDLLNYPELAVRAGEINAIGLIDEIFHLVFSIYRQNEAPDVMSEALDFVHSKIGEHKLNVLFTQFLEEFPPLDVYQGKASVETFLNAEHHLLPNRQLVLEEIIMLWLTNKNPAVTSFSELFDDSGLSSATAYQHVINLIASFFKTQPFFGPDHQDLITMLRSPAITVPNSLTGQLEYIREKWGALIGDVLYRLLSAIDLIQEENQMLFPIDGSGATFVPHFDMHEDQENFSPDSEWMPYTVMLAKNTYVWLYQLSQSYQTEIKHLDQIPDEELDKLANWGFNGLWLIGLWERSEASKQIKQMCGNPEAVASAYSLKHYAIAEALGGEEAYLRLKEKSSQRGIRLASDMVPNHMGLDSDWVINHPDWFIAQNYSPFPAYTFNGPDLSPTNEIGLFIEDHYYDRSDAAVVFKRVDYSSGDNLYIYHGNDGTSMPWNDTAQLNYLKNEVREAVIQTILDVARKFPIIRFDAAMTLAKKHYQRLWFPQPGTGGAIPSRSEQSMSKADFDREFPVEFWREVVDRVAEEVPDTLLLAEAFWLMEGYFVRTLGMHRVYNSAFMNMLRNEENDKYRQVIKNTLAFDPQILKRYVNFMNNPDEKTAVEQFGKGDKYFGICTLMATMPGLPMFGHGQIEGLAEKYGMEYFRPYWDESPDTYLIQRHEREIFPLLRRRDLFADVKHFYLFDFYTDQGSVNENVYAYSNSSDHDHALILYHNQFNNTSGWINISSSYLNKNTGRLEHKKLFEALGITGNENHYVIFNDCASGLEFIRSSRDVIEKGLTFELNAYECHVFINFREVEDNEEGHYGQLLRYLNNRGVPNIDQAINELVMAPVIQPFINLVNQESIDKLYQHRVLIAEKKLNVRILESHIEKYHHLMGGVGRFIQSERDVTPILKEHHRGLEAILKLHVFDERYPFPQSNRYQSMIDFIQDNLDDDFSTWYVLTVWNDLRLLGRLVTDSDYEEISRSWLEEWGLLKALKMLLSGLNWSHDRIEQVIILLKILVNNQNWVHDELQTPIKLVEGWLTNQEIRTFLNINRYRDRLWFNKEAFESLTWWLMTIALIVLVSDPDHSLTDAVEVLFDAYKTIEAILVAKENSDYQVEKLLEELKYKTSSSEKSIAR